MTNERPYSFLVSTPGERRADETLDALAPVLEELGDWRRLESPESSLIHAADAAERSGRRPVHLAIGPAHACYLTPAVPTALIPIWDYADIPANDWIDDTRLNWRRVAEHLDLILAPSEFLADAFRRIDVSTPISVLPIPARSFLSDLPTWGPNFSVSLDVAHALWTVECEEDEDEDEAASESTTSHPLMVAVKRRLRRIKPYLSNDTVHKIDGYRRRFEPVLRGAVSLSGLAEAARLGYRSTFRRWMGEEAHRSIRKRITAIRGIGRVSATETGEPPIPLRLSGLVYATNFDASDPTSGHLDLISAFLHAFRDREDATLLIRLATTADRRDGDLAQLEYGVRAPGIDFQCRFLVVPDAITLEEDLALAEATTYFIDTHRSRGSALSVIEALSAGRPVLAPNHSATGEWVSDDVGFVLASDPEPGFWPVDPEFRHRTTWRRLVWADLRDRLIQSAEIADRDPRGYENRSAAARRVVADRARPDKAVDALRSALDRMKTRPAGALGW